MDQHNVYVRTDEHGVMRVGQTHVMLDSVLAAFEQGHTPETIRSQYPALSLEQVYGSITYYLSHRPEIDEYLRRQDAEWAKWETESRRRCGSVVERLRALKCASAGQLP